MMGISRPAFNKGFKTVVKFLFAIVFIQIMVIAYLATPGSIFKVEKEEDLKPLPGEDILSQVTEGETLIGENGRLLLNVTSQTRNLLYKEQYSNAELAFAKKLVPGVLLDWKPQADSYKYFKPIEGKDAWIYSAFFDHQKAHKGHPMIRGFGIVRMKYKRKIFCTFYDSASKNIMTRPGWALALPESHDTLVVTSAFECNIPKNYFPQVVSISFLAKNVITNQVKIQYPGHMTRNFTVCYSVLHSRFSYTSELIQSVEFNTLLGAEHFFVYNFSISAETDMVLRHYQSLGKMTIMQWPLPTIEAWYLSQMIAVNDCLYRNRNVSRYVVVVDTDEILIPRHHLTWAGLIDEILTNENMSVNVPDKEYEGTIEILDLTAEEKSRQLRSVLQGEEKLSTKMADKNKTQAKETTLDKVTSNKVNGSLPKNLDKILSAKNSSSSHNSLKFQNGTEDGLKSPKAAKEPTVLPKQNTTVDKSIKSKKKKNIGSFVFRCAFFDFVESKFQDEVMTNISLSPEDRQIVKMFRVQPLSAFMRTNYIFPHKVRTKLIVRPEFIYTSGIHFVYYHMLNATTSWVKTEAGLVHHYREYDRPRSQTPDISALRFKNALLTRLKPIYATFPQLFMTKPSSKI